MINNSYSNKRETLQVVPQGSVHGTLLFNIDLINLNLQCDDDNNNSYANNTSPYSWAEDKSSVITELQKIDQKNFRQYEDNQMKANSEKSDVLLSSNIERVVPFYNVQITSGVCEKLLGITFDSEL